MLIHFRSRLLGRASWCQKPYYFVPRLAQNLTKPISTSFSCRREEKVEVDTSGLMQPVKKEELTPLGQELRDIMRLKGPISVSEYMFQCLAHPQHGYYMRSKEKIGKEGDFITAPEISQMFGELLGVWCVAVWESMGSPKNIQLVEMGPGKGTLMHDLLRSASSFPAFMEALDGINMVETSKSLQAVQQKKLGAVKLQQQVKEPLYVLPGGNKIRWVDLFWEVPKAPVIVIAQELLDALPVHQFEYTSEGWRERLVDVSRAAADPLNFRFVTSVKETLACQNFLTSKSLKQQKEDAAFMDMKDGDSIEVCPLAIALAEDVADRIGKFGGAALFIDYGENHALSESLRAFKDHKEVHLLSAPGECDITADVDFAAIERAVAKKPNVQVAGAVEQGALLVRLGIEQRLLALINRPDVSDEKANELYDSCMRLIDREQMGRKYKALTIYQNGISTPPGFSHLSNKNGDDC